MRQAFAGLLWSKQYYHYVVREWLARRSRPAAAAGANAVEGRNHEWQHLYNADVISMPDKWEYPWYAAWDLAFHCIPLALVDSEFAKEQLVLLLREWYMHPNGQLPAYEWNFGDVNPPVHAWAALRVYRIDQQADAAAAIGVPRARVPQAAAQFHLVGQPQGRRGEQHLRGRLPRARQHRRVRSQQPLPGGAHLEQSDGTSWMAMYTLNLLAIAMELADEDPVYEDIASKFWEHFLYIAHAMSDRGDDVARPVGRGRRLLLRRAAHARRPPHPAEGPVDGRADSALRGRDAGAVDARAHARLQPAHGVVPRQPARPHAQRRVDGGSRPGRAPAAVDRRSRAAAPHPAPPCSTSASSSRPTASARLSRVHQRSSVRASSSTASELLGRLRARRVDQRRCSAATRTGAGRCGFR